MRLFQRSSPLWSPRLQQPRGADEVGAVEDVEEEAAEVEVAKETARQARSSHAPEVVPNIQICPRESGQGVICITAGGKVHFSVQNHQHVLGRIFTLQNLQNKTKIEKLTSSASIVTLNEYMTFYILNKSCQKYRKIVF